MPLNNAPVKADLVVDDSLARWNQPWHNWFRLLRESLFGWTRTFTGSVTFDFGNIATATEGTTTVTITGARVNDAVIVTPSTRTAGIIESGLVTANDTVTIYAQNTTAGTINPASKTYKVIVFQG